MNGSVYESPNYMNAEAWQRAADMLHDAAVNPDGHLVRLWCDAGSWYITVGDADCIERFDLTLGIWAPRAFRWIAGHTVADVRAEAARRGGMIRLAQAVAANPAAP